MSYFTINDIEQIRGRHLARKAVREFGVEVLFNKDDAASIVSFKNEYDGGPGSGNWGHEGRKGKVGGSTKGGGSHNRQTTSSGKFTSFSKQRKAAAAPHKTTVAEISRLPEDTEIIVNDKNTGRKNIYTPIPGSGKLYCYETGSMHNVDEFVYMRNQKNQDVRILIPNSANPNFNKAENSTSSTSNASAKKNKKNTSNSSELKANKAQSNTSTSPEAAKTTPSKQEIKPVEPVSNASSAIENAKVKTVEAAKSETSVSSSAMTQSESAKPASSAVPSEYKIKELASISPERIKAAKVYEYVNEADKELREDSGKVWNSLDYLSKKSLFQYTGDYYESINGALRGDKKFQGGLSNYQANSITASIAKSHLKEDTILFRGVGYDSISKMFNLGVSKIAGNEKNLIGKTGTDSGFMSCSTTHGHAFDTGVMLKVFCPKGTEALYAEPFSANGGNEEYGLKWDGKSKQSWYGESEVIVQRGTSYTCTGCKLNQDTGKLEVEIAITGQSPKELDW